jgi:hypothetical protein
LTICKGGIRQATDRVFFFFHLFSSNYNTPTTQILGMAPPLSMKEELPSYDEISKPALAFLLSPPPPYTTAAHDDAEMLEFSGFGYVDLPLHIRGQPVYKTRMLMTMVAVVITTGLMVTLGVLLFPASATKPQQQICWNPCSNRSETINTNNCCEGLFCNPSC